ncbi:hypothetical protein AVEN_80748-1 [Araneus ventricosus]|uniref:MATH domain-containing protein n=1 Tax=Araneus ventricosus TaxID=182803 RepID=A0A4Y2MRU4_ARAVE|nr:hypothetical protein AVEN_80748-1 [Araneus ventricosus]
MAFSFYTSNAKEVLEFDWVIEKFSCMPRVIRGPLFHPFSDCHEKWLIELQFGYSKIEVFLVRLAIVLDQLSVKANLTFCNVHNELICSATKWRPVLISSGESRCDLKVIGIFRIGAFEDLPEDKLKVRAEFTVAGHKSHSSTDALPALPTPTM